MFPLITAIIVKLVQKSSTHPVSIIVLLSHCIQCTCEHVREKNDMRRLVSVLWCGNGMNEEFSSPFFHILSFKFFEVDECK